MKKPKKNKQKSSDLVEEAEFFDTAIVGTKGQFVIPKAARDKYGIETGEKLLIFGGKDGVLAIVKADMLHELLSEIKIPDPTSKT